MKRIIEMNQMMVFFLVLVFVTGLMANQNQRIQELEKKLANISGKEKIKLLNELASAYSTISVEKMLKYAGGALELSKSLNDLKGEAEALQNISIGCQLAGNFEKSLENAEKS